MAKRSNRAFKPRSTAHALSTNRVLARRHDPVAGLSTDVAPDLLGNRAQRRAAARLQLTPTGRTH